MFASDGGYFARREKCFLFHSQLPVVRGDAAGDDLTPRSPPARPPLSARLLPHLDSLTGEISSLSPDGIAFTPQIFPREKNTRIAEEQK